MCGGPRTLYELSFATAAPARRRSTAAGFVIALLGLEGAAPRSLQCSSGATPFCVNPLATEFNPFTDDAAFAVAVSKRGALAAAAAPGSGGGGGGATRHTAVEEEAAWDASVPRWRPLFADVIALLPSGTGAEDCWTLAPAQAAKRLELTSAPAPRVRPVPSRACARRRGMIMKARACSRARAARRRA